jgi:hypothetical protein
VRTGCRRAAYAGRADGGGDDPGYRIELASAPVDGRANAELAGFLAKEFHVRSDDVEIRSGKSSRRKLVRIAGDSSPPEWFGG